MIPTRTLTPGALSVSRQRQEQERPEVSRELLALPVTAITTAGVTLYTVPDAAHFQVMHFAVCNHTSGVQTFSLHIVESGGTAGDSNVIYSEVDVAGNYTSTPENRWGLVAPAGSSFVISSSVNSALNVLFSGMTIYNGDLE